MPETTIMTRPCLQCGEPSMVTLDNDKLARYKAGELVQRVWPEMSTDERELLITGTHPACWSAMFGGSDEL